MSCVQSCLVQSSQSAFPLRGSFCLFCLSLLLKVLVLPPAFGSSPHPFPQPWQNEPTKRGLSRTMGIFLFPSPCPSAHQMTSQRWRLLSLRQGGASVKDFAYQFLFVAEGLNISDAELKDIFNTSLNEPVHAWEMGMLGILSFWQFVGYVYHRGEEGGLPPLGPPPIPLTDYLVPSPPMTRNRRRRKNGPAVAPPEAADDAARPVAADDTTAACPEVAEDTAAPPEEAGHAAASPVEAEEAAAPPVVADDAAAPQRASGEAAAHPEAADDAAAAPPVEANDAAASPEVAQNAALPPEAVIPPSRSRRRRRRRKASSAPHGLEAIQDLAVSQEAIQELAVSQEAVPEPSAGQGVVPELPKRLALPAPPKRLALPAPPKRLALPAHPKRLALPAHPKRLALPAPFRIPVLPAPFRIPVLPAPFRIPVLPGPPWQTAKLLAPPWPPDGLEPAWSVPPAPPWPSSRVPVRPDPPWFIPPWPSSRVPVWPDPPWSVPPASPWLPARIPVLREPPWLNPPVPPWTCWASLLALAWLPSFPPSLPSLSLCLIVLVWSVIVCQSLCSQVLVLSCFCLVLGVPH